MLITQILILTARTSINYVASYLAVRAAPRVKACTSAAGTGRTERAGCRPAVRASPGPWWAGMAGTEEAGLGTAGTITRPPGGLHPAQGSGLAPATIGTNCTSNYVGSMHSNREPQHHINAQVTLNQVPLFTKYLCMHSKRCYD